MKSYGDGARAIVRIQYSDTIRVTGPDGRPKTFVVEKQNNVDTVCDIITRKPVDLSSYYPGSTFPVGIGWKRYKTGTDPA